MKISLTTIDMPSGLHQKKAAECGSCEACCDFFKISELNKSERTSCIHQLSVSGDKNERGCEIYRTRPKACVDFHCEWLKGTVNAGKLAYRPDRLGLIFTTMDIPPLEGVLGVFKVNKYGRLSTKARVLLRQIENKRLYYFEGSLFGPQKLIDKLVQEKNLLENRGM